MLRDERLSVFDCETTNIFAWRRDEGRDDRRKERNSIKISVGVEMQLNWISVKEGGKSLASAWVVPSEKPEQSLLLVQTYLR